MSNISIAVDQIVTRRQAKSSNDENLSARKIVADLGLLSPASILNNDNFKKKINRNNLLHNNNNIDFYLQGNDSKDSVESTERFRPPVRRNNSNLSYDRSYNDELYSDKLDNDKLKSEKLRSDTFVSNSKVNGINDISLFNEIKSQGKSTPSKLVFAPREISEEYSDTEEDLANYRFYGILLLSGTAVYFTVGMSAIFNLWGFLGSSDSSAADNEKSVGDFPVENYFVYVVFLCPTIFWIWCIFSWVGMKLFRHAKGIATV